MSTDPAVITEITNVLNTLNTTVTGLTVQQLPDIIVQILTVVSNLKTLSTDQQKAVVIGTVQIYMTKYNLTVAEQTIIMAILPTLIDNLIALDNGTITISSIDQTASNDCGPFCLWLKSLNCKCKC